MTTPHTADAPIFGAPMTPAPTPFAPDDVDPVVAAYKFDQERIERLVRAMAEQSKADAQRLQSLERLLEQLARQAVAPVAPLAAQPVQFGALEQFASMAKIMREIAAPAPQTTMADTMQMMMTFLDFREKIAASAQAAGDGSGFGSLLPALIGPLTELLQRESAKTPATPPAPAVPAVRQLPAPSPTPPATQAVMPPSVIGDLLAALPTWAKMAISAQASQNVDPATIVDHVLAALSDDVLAKFAEAIADTDAAVEEITMRIPSWIPYKSWLRRLLKVITERLMEELADTGDEPDGGRAPREASDTPSDTPQPIEHAPMRQRERAG